jgi:drug/metabolite transporter (DMT)-like permease
MNSKQLTQAITIFVVFLIVGILMIVLPYNIDLDQSNLKTSLQVTLPLIGTAMIASGLTFFLLEMTRLDREKQSN